MNLYEVQGMEKGESGIADIFSTFSPDEISRVEDFLRSLEGLRVSDAQKVLDSVSAGYLPYSGFPAIRAYFMAAGKLDIASTEKKNIVYEILKTKTVENLLSMLNEMADKNIEQTATRETVSEKNSQGAKESQAAFPVNPGFAPPLSQRVTPINGYYLIDDEEYTVKSKFVHPSPSGIEEGYPALSKKKKKTRS